MIDFKPTGKFAYAVGQANELFLPDRFDSSEEALLAARKAYPDADVFIGEVETTPFAEFLKADVVIVNAMECARDYTLESFTDKFESEIPKDAVTELQDFLKAWSEKHSIKIERVENPVEYTA